MNYRNERFNQFGSIDADIDHPDFGWIPCTFASDDDPTSKLFQAAKVTAKPYVSPEE